MEYSLTRLEWLLGKAGVEKIKSSSVAVFGCGGVGSFAMEVLARSGVGRIVLVDGDVISSSNINRQLTALPENVGHRKVEVAKARCVAINPEIQVVSFDIMYTAERYPNLLEDLKVDFIVDAIDMVTAKLDIIEGAKRLGIPAISAMGFGNKIDPLQIQLVPIEKTHTCPLAKVMRKELKKRGISRYPVVFSPEEPRRPERAEDSRSPGSCGFVPSVAGIALASYVLRKLSGVME